MEKYDPLQHKIHANQQQWQNIIGTFSARTKQAMLHYCQSPKEENKRRYRTHRKLHIQHRKALGNYLLASITKNTISQHMHWLVHRHKLYTKPKSTNSHTQNHDTASYSLTRE